jgi:hypothetical protein
MSPNAGEEGGCGVSANENSCAHRVTWSPNKFGRSNSIFNLWITVYTEYCTIESVPSSEIGSPPPSPVSECVSLLGPKGGGDQYSLAVEGVGDPIPTTEQKAWHSVYSVSLHN